MSTIIGLTGGIASGKSTVSNFIRDQGIPIVDADEIAKELTQPGREGWHEIVSYFGKQILTSGCEINRKLLGGMVFGSEQNREKLNEIMHPLIEKVMLNQIEIYKNQGQEIIVLDVPLLIEANMVHLADTVWLVYVNSPLQIQRLMERNNLTQDEALQRIQSQMSFEKKREYADIIIDNNGSRENTCKQILTLLEGIRVKK